MAVSNLLCAVDKTYRRMCCIFGCPNNQRNLYTTFSGFSVGFRINEEKVISYQLELGNNLPTFPLNAPVVIRALSLIKILPMALMMTGAFSQNIGKL